MAKYIYGKEIGVIKYHSNNESAIIDRVAELYETKSQIKCIVWRSGWKGWREKPNEPFASIVWGKDCGRDNAIKIVCEIAGVPTGMEIEEPTHNYGTLKEL